MSKLLSLSILGMAVAGAVAVLVMPSLFVPTVPDYAVPTLAGAGGAFVVFTVSAFTWRRRLQREQPGHPDD